MGILTCGFRHHTLLVLQKQKMRARELSRIILGPLCRGFNSVLYWAQNSQYFQDYRLSVVPQAAKLATKVNSSALGLCYARKTTLDWFSRLLQLITPVLVSGEFLAFFPLFALFHSKFTSFLPQRATGKVNICCCRPL